MARSRAADRATLVGKLQTKLGRLQRPGVPFEQRDIQAAFNGSDHSAQGRLRRPNPKGGVLKRAGVDDYGDLLQMAGINDHIDLIYYLTKILLD